MADKKQKKQGGGKSKRFGPKMANPRIKQSKEHRGCGPLGYAHRAQEKKCYFVTRAQWIANPRFALRKER